MLGNLRADYRCLSQNASGQFSAAMHILLRHNVGNMEFYSAFRDAEERGNLPIGIPLAQQVEDLAFSLGQHFDTASDAGSG